MKSKWSIGLPEMVDGTDKIYRLDSSLITEDFLRMSDMDINSVMQLRKVEIIEFYFKINENRASHSEDDSPENFEVNIMLDIPQKTDLLYEQKLLLEFDMYKNSELCMFDELCFKVLGYFMFSRSMKEKELQEFLLYNGSVILYSMMRAHVLQFSALTEVSRLILPTINTHVLVENYLREQQN